MNAGFAVGFDFDHTLGLDHGLELTALHRLAEDVGAPLTGNERALACAREELARFRAGEQTAEAMISTVLACAGASSDAGRVAAWREHCFALVERVTPIDGARELLAELAARAVPVAILTNGWSPLQEKKIARALDFHGPILVSETIGALKPDPAAFGFLVRALGLPAERCWYVGDNPLADVLGALDAGLQGVWFDAESGAYPRSARSPSGRIRALDELGALLPGSRASAQNVRP